MGETNIMIHIWKTQPGNVGHGSLTLSNGTHISLWPEKQKRKDNFYDYLPVDAYTPDSYDEDMELEGAPASNNIPIRSNNINEKAIEDWWRAFKEHGKYHILFRNCCSAVYMALKKGKANLIAEFPEDIVSTPQNLQGYATRLQLAANQ